MRRPYAWPDLRIMVESTEERHLDWLDEFLAPSFSARGGHRDDYTVRLVRDAERYHQALTAGRANGDIDVFVQDTCVVRLPARRDRAHWLVFDKSYGTVYRLSDLGSPIEILHSGTRTAVRGGLMRVVRELAMNHAIHAGDFILHAACLSVEGRGLIIAGPKRSGKTTLLVHLLGAEGAQYVTNDRLLVCAEEGLGEVRGIPTIVCLREDLFRFFPRLRVQLMEGWYRWLLSLRECSEKPHPPPKPWPDGRFGITPAQFCSMASRPAIERAHPHAVVFPQVTQRPGSVSILPLSEHETASRLYASLFAAGHGTAGSQLFVDRTRVREDRRDLREACAALARSLRGYSCELGLDVTYAASDARLLAEQLTDA
jgi:hypothetical protein